MNKLIGSSVLALLLCSRAFGWSAEGHRTVAEIAYPLLNATAKAQVDVLIAQDPNHGTFADAATWPDDIKSSSGIGATPEAKAFNEAHPDNKQWHYVNFPVGATGYSTTSSFSTSTDIVHVFQGCIDTLEGKPFLTNFSKLDALRYLIHLAGDVHQPLHTITGYYRITNGNATLLKVTNSVPSGSVSDEGGNALKFPQLHDPVSGAATNELHALFDRELVADIDQTMVSETLAAKLLTGVKITSFPTTGAYRNWITTWAGDSMKLANTAYAGLKFGKAKMNNEHPDELYSIATTLPANYLAQETPVVSLQLQKGGVHLAQVLNSIQWGN
jgi:hypothetical protein